MVNNMLIIAKEIPFVYVTPKQSKGFARIIWDQYENIVTPDSFNDLPDKDELAGEDYGLQNVLENDVAIENYGDYMEQINFETDDEWEEFLDKVYEQEGPFWQDVRTILYHLQVPFYDWEKGDQLVNSPIVGVW